MKLIRDIVSVPAELRQSVAVLGNFDGVHLGHRALIECARSLAEQQGRPLLVVSFEPHPRRVLSRADLPEFRTMTLRQKFHALADLGVGGLVALRFTRAFAALTAEEFIDQILLAGLAVHTVVVGHDFCFGAHRQGHLATLQARSEFATLVIEPQVTEKAQLYSSTAVRMALAAGDCAAVRENLGRNWSLSGRVQSGDQRGRTIGFPTANLPIRRVLTPRLGVYAVAARLGAERLEGIANIGIRPTFGGTVPRLEVHLFNFNRNIYGKRLTVELGQFIRPEQKFANLAELQAQIAQDCRAAQNFLETNPPLFFAQTAELRS
ncbi:MAG: riboflavin biosynthesis protein RibF [Alphaproteobacteria bacterium]|nr:riboflavin biosynthesis protein RibF [Alphaproteobacteria bacterium]